MAVFEDSKNLFSFFRFNGSLNEEIQRNGQRDVWKFCIGEVCEEEHIKQIMLYQLYFQLFVKEMKDEASTIEFSSLVIFLHC